MRAKDEHKEKLIKEVTLDVVNELGFAGVKMADIAKRADLSPSTLYVYYRSKEDLIMSVFIDITNDVFSDISPDTADVPFKLKMQKYFNRILAFKTKHQKENNFFKMFFVSPYYSQDVEDLVTDAFKSFYEVLTIGQESMILKDKVELKLLMAVIDGMTDKLLEYKNKGSIELNKKNISDSFDMVWDSIKQ